MGKQTQLWDGDLSSWVNLNPSLANLSIRGVATPRVIPPPLNPGSPQPKLSIKTITIFGLSCAKPFENRNELRIIIKNFVLMFVLFICVTVNVRICSFGLLEGLARL